MFFLIDLWSDYGFKGICIPLIEVSNRPWNASANVSNFKLLTMSKN